MSLTNQSKPTEGQSQTELLVGGGFKLLVGSLYDLVINPAIAGSFLNIIRPNQGETWGTIATTWASETRSWLAVSQLFQNRSKPTTAFTNVTRPV